MYQWRSPDPIDGGLPYIPTVPEAPAVHTSDGCNHKEYSQNCPYPNIVPHQSLQTAAKTAGSHILVPSEARSSLPRLRHFRPSAACVHFSAAPMTQRPFASDALPSAAFAVRQLPDLISFPCGSAVLTARMLPSVASIHAHLFEKCFPVPLSSLASASPAKVPENVPEAQPFLP